MQMQSTYWLEKVLNALLCTLQHIVICAMQLSSVRIDTAESHRNMLQCAQKCIDVQGDHFQHLL